MKRFLIFLMLFFCACYSFAQEQTPETVSINGLPGKFLARVNQKVSSLNNQLDKKTERYLRKLARHDNKLKRQLFKLDSNATKNLFLVNTDQRYKTLANKLRDTSTSQSLSAREYLPYADSLQGSLAFLHQNPQLLYSSKVLPGDVQRTIQQLRQYQASLQVSDEIKEAISQRKEQIKQYLRQFSHLPTGISDSYAAYNKEFYYYNAQVADYKKSLNDPDKLSQQILTLLDRLPAFQNFMKSNSMLAGLFPASANYGTPIAIAGLPTRDDIAAMMKGRLSSGSGAQEMFSQQVEAAQSHLEQLRDKILKNGGSGGDVDLPGFKPNTQRTKSFLKRIQYGTDFQTQQSNAYFVTTTDIGLSAGYKLNDKSTIGLGASYKLGWGSDIQHVKISNQGVGLRSFLDVQIKKNFYASGLFEYNYQPLTVIGQILPPSDLSKWQQSGMLGISKILSTHAKAFKKTKLQLLWDFLSYRQIPRGQPFKFRIGYIF